MPKIAKSASVSRNVALCYVRQSFTRDANDMNSPERQRANIQTICEREGWRPLWFVDADGHKSGRSEKNRQNWLALKTHFDDPDVIALVANDLSRIHRKAWRVGRLVDEVLDEREIRLVLAAPGREIDTATPMGKLLLTFMAMQDESYANDIAQRSKDSIIYRKSLGKTIGRPPFGTIRNADGYLMPSPAGAWLLSNGQFAADEGEHGRSEDGAVWRGYYDCAKRILELYAEDKHGRETISYILTDEGWAFCDRRNCPRPITKDDIRRVTSNWREYAGLVSDGRAKDQNASLIENPTQILHDTGRAVFSLDLLRRVAEVQEKRCKTTRPRGSVKSAYPYALARLVYCAHCDERATARKNPKLRSRLGGVDNYGKLRYRHAEGVKCGCKSRSVPVSVLDSQFRELIGLLQLNPSAYSMLVELAIQSEHGETQGKSKQDVDKEKKAGIAKCRRRIEAAKSVFLDGDMSSEEYLKVKEFNEREIVHWETRTTETEQAALEFKMCMNMANEIAHVWDTSGDEDRQQMAHMLFEYIVYDLDKREIVDFRLKSWADRYLIVRADMLRSEAENENRLRLKDTGDLCPIGESNPCFGLERATS